MWTPTERAGGAGVERGAAGECELRGQEQLPAELPGIRAGSVGEVLPKENLRRSQKDAEQAAVLVLVY